MALANRLSRWLRGVVLSALHGVVPGCGPSSGGTETQASGPTTSGTSAATNEDASAASSGDPGTAVGTSTEAATATTSTGGGSSSETGAEATCEFGTFLNNSNVTLDLSNWPAPTEPSGDVDIDAECLVGTTEEPPSQGVIHHMMCADDGGAEHELALVILASPSIHTELVEGESVRLRFARRGTSFWLTVGDETENLRMIAIQANDFEFPGIPDAYGPFSLSLETGLCEPDAGLCGDRERAAIRIDFGRESILLFDNMTPSLGENSGYIATADDVSFYAAPEECDAQPEPLYVHMIIAKGVFQ